MILEYLNYLENGVTLEVAQRIAGHADSGLILALFGTAITLGTISAFAGFAFMLISFVRKLKIEETWLRSQFGAEYEAYQNRVKALIPRF